MKVLISLVCALLLCGCASNILSVKSSKNDGGLGISDQTAATFVQLNNVYAFSAGRGNPKAWPQFRSVFKKLIEPALFADIDRYMNLEIAEIDPADMWWMQRGILFLGGNHSWRCVVRRVGYESAVATYRVDQFVHKSKGSFGRNDPVFFKVAMRNNHYVVIDILFAFDPFEKGVRKNGVSIKRFTEYAALN